MIELKFSKIINKNLEIKLHIEAPRHKCIAIYGKSGAGKSSILRLISGLDSITMGKIQYGNKIFESKKFNIYNEKFQIDKNHSNASFECKNATSKNAKCNLQLDDFKILESSILESKNLDSGKNYKDIFLSVKDRKIGFIFQNYALMPHLNVRENILFGARCKEDMQKLDKLVELLHISHIIDKNIHILSGGEAQRVSLARALISSPDILMLDEPLSALDSHLRLSLMKELRFIFSHFKISSFLVSHDVEEILSLADYVLHLENGEVISFLSLQDFINKNLNQFSLFGNIIDFKNDDVAVKIRSITIIAKNKYKNLKIGDRVRIMQKDGMYFIEPF